MGRQEREVMVKELDGQLDGAVSIVITDYRGIDAEKSVLLRRKFRESNVKYSVVKNTLVKMAAEKRGMSDLAVYFSGPTALAISKDDPMAPSRILKEFLTEFPGSLQIKGGYVEGNVLDVDGVNTLANLPSREELLGKVVGSMQAPIKSLMNVLTGPMRNLVGVLNAIKDKKEIQ